MDRHSVLCSSFDLSFFLSHKWASQVGQWQRICLPMQEIQETQVWSLGQEELLEQEMAIHPSLLAWDIRWTEEPGGLQFTGVSKESDMTELMHTHIFSLTNAHSYYQWRDAYELEKESHSNAQCPALQILMLYAAAKSLQSCLTLCNPIDGSPPGSPIPGILQAKTLEWVAISFSNAWEWKVKVKSLSRVQLCNPMGCSLPGSSFHGIFQARVLEWGAIAFSTDAVWVYLITVSSILNHPPTNLLKNYVCVLQRADGAIVIHFNATILLFLIHITY